MTHSLSTKCKLNFYTKNIAIEKQTTQIRFYLGPILFLSLTDVYYTSYSINV